MDEDFMFIVINADSIRAQGSGSDRWIHTTRTSCCAYGVVIVIKFIQNFNLKTKCIDSVKYVFLGMEKLTYWGLWSLFV